MAVGDKVKSIIAEQLGVKPDEVTPEASFIDDLGADSLERWRLGDPRRAHMDIEVDRARQAHGPQHLR